MTASLIEQFYIDVLGGGNLGDAYEGCHGNRYRGANVSRNYLNRKYGEQPSTEARFNTAADSALEMSCFFCS